MLRLSFLMGLLACGDVASTRIPDGGGDGSGDAGGTSGGGLEVTPPSVDFGMVSAAVLPTPQTLSITNRSATPATLQLVLTGADAARFQLATGACTTPLAQDAGCEIPLSVDVDRDGAYTAALEISADTSQVTVPLAATAVAAGLIVSPTSDQLGDVGLATTVTREYTATNTGDAELPAPTASIAGDAAFTLGGGTCASPLVAGGSCTFTVHYHPVVVGGQTAIVTVASGALVAELQLAGRGTSQLSVVKQGTGAGTVNGGGLACGNTCAATVATTPVTITAAPAAGSRFVAWGGAAATCGTAATCTLAIGSAAVAATAAFDDLPTLTVLVNNGPLSEGSVTIDNPAGTCTGTCTSDYAVATTVHLTARADTTTCTQFDGWSGACAGTSASCTVNVNANLSAVAGFSRTPNCIPQ